MANEFSDELREIVQEFLRLGGRLITLANKIDGIETSVNRVKEN